MNLPKFSLARPSRLTSEDLAILAYYIAYDRSEINGSLSTADDHGWRWYQEQVGADICTDNQARDLRFMVMLECSCFEAGGGHELIPTFAVAVPEDPKRAPRVHISRFEMFVYEHFESFVVAFLVCGLVSMLAIAAMKGGRQ